MRRSSAASLSFVLALLVVSSCRRNPVPPPFTGTDSGPPPDTSIPAMLDSDGDGMCDFTEIQRRTDPNDPDSDDDGFSDFVEAQNGSMPNDLSSPDRSILIVMSEAPDGSIEVPVSFAVRGIGESFSGEPTRIPIYLTDDGTEALSFYGGASTLGATPPENVHGGMDATTYYGVIGRTLLRYTVRFQQVQEARGCMRAYPFQYSLKADDGALRGSVQHWLVLMPPGMSIGAPGARWCTPTTVACY